MSGPPRIPIAVRLAAKTKRTGNGCWIWQGAVDKDGYGRIHRSGVGGGMLFTHRAAWELARGPIPSGQQVLHKCDNPPCVNPRHLFLGTQLDNIRDRDAKGRAVYLKGDEHWTRRRADMVPRGERHWHAKLTERAVRQIVASVRAGELQRVVAERHGVVLSAVNAIMKGRAWTRVSGLEPAS